MINTSPNCVRNILRLKAREFSFHIIIISSFPKCLYFKSSVDEGILVET
uniref:Uncharacterized protein n=1 Tax=Schistosoma curassoni TaxID=6186 RepID=A0A183KLC0_9TREM